jgi:hypothetical protein
MARGENGRPAPSSYGLNDVTPPAQPQTVTAKDIWRKPESFIQSSVTSAHYAALKVKNDNQYGQLDAIRQIPVGCINLWTLNYTQLASSTVIFGGDMYVNRYTEKSTFFYFSQWMQDMPDNTEWDYRLYNMLPFPRYWMDTTKYNSTDLLGGIFGDDINVDDGINHPSFS